MLRSALPVLIVSLVLAACQHSIQDKEQVRKDLVEYLSTKVGLDLKVLDVDVTRVTFTGNEARASVSFHQKNNSSIDAGMVMNYLLEAKDGHWVVKGRADSQGRGFGTKPHGEGGEGNLPAGHPSLGEQPLGGQPLGGQQGLPPGHPSVGNTPPAAAGGSPQGRTR